MDDWPEEEERRAKNGTCHSLKSWL